MGRSRADSGMVGPVHRPRTLALMGWKIINVAEGDRMDRPTSRRREGPAAPESPPSFLSEVKSDIRGPLTFLVGLPWAVWWLSVWVLGTQGWAAWSIGISGTLVAFVLLLSYVLRFFPGVLWHSFWAHSRSRRVVQLVLIWAWEAALAILFVTCLVALLT